jgi:two-component system, OmpR family, phosphate regulon sensor histidine kinase PhoR
LTELWLPLLAFIAAVAVAMVVRHRIQLRRLIRWAGEPIGTAVPDAPGLWGTAFSALHQRARMAAKQREQLHQALERFQQAAQAMPDGVAILGDKFAIEWLNGHAERLLGLENARDAGAPIVNLIREPDFVAYMQGGDYSRPRLIHPVRRPAASLQIQAIPFSEGRTMLLVRDVTQIERLETMRRDFVANVSHELKTPLTVIGGFVETLTEAWRDLSDDEIRNYLVLAGDQATRMGRLIDDLLTLSALETDALPTEEPVDMAALLAEVRDEALALSGGRHEIALHDEGPATVLGNPRELRSAFANITTNAVRYTPPGGRIELRWHRTDDGGAAFAVTDTGMGIEPQHIPRLTERFYRVDRGRSREMGGTGLGLAIVKHVLERHGGRLDIRSTPGEGSCFTALLPSRRVPAGPPR